MERCLEIIVMYIYVIPLISTIENIGSDIKTDLWIGGTNTGTITVQNNTRYTPNDSSYTPEYIASSVPGTASVNLSNNSATDIRKKLTDISTMIISQEK